MYINTNARIEYEHITYYCLWKDARIVYNLKSLHVPSLTTGPSINTAVIIAPILVGMVMLLVGITLLVIGVILIMKRKRHTPTVQHDKESKVQYYDEVDDDVKSTEDIENYGEMVVKRKGHKPTVRYDKESKVHIYDEVGNYVKSTKDTKAYQELDVNKMDDTKQYATIK